MIVGLESNMFDLKVCGEISEVADAIVIHVQREYKEGPDVSKAIRDLALPDFPPPRATTPLQKVLQI